jgi:hypothetical protein
MIVDLQSKINSDPSSDLLTSYLRRCVVFAHGIRDAADLGGPSRCQGVQQTPLFGTAGHGAPWPDKTLRRPRLARPSTGGPAAKAVAPYRSL